jgi:hypothetical protein
MGDATNFSVVILATGAPGYISKAVLGRQDAFTRHLNESNDVTPIVAVRNGECAVSDQTKLTGHVRANGGFGLLLPGTILAQRRGRRAEELINSAIGRFAIVVREK